MRPAFRIVQAALGVLLVLGLLLAVPHVLTASRVFTCVFAAFVMAVYARLCLRWKAPRRSALAGAALAAAVPMLALADVAAFVYSDAPFWIVADTAPFCAGSGQGTPACHREGILAAAAAPQGPVVYLAAEGWHTGMIVPTASLDESVWPFAKTLKNRRFVDIGWGDATFYQADHPTLQMALGAFFVPGPSVLQLAPFDGDVAKAYPDAEIVRVPLSADGMRRLTAYVAAALPVDPDGQPIVTGPGDTPESHFYRANGLYYFPHTCNAWAADALAAGGLPLTPELAATSRNLIHQAELVGFAGP